MLHESEVVSQNWVEILTEVKKFKHLPGRSLYLLPQVGCFGFAVH
jgi:hypothetical protein